MRPSHSRQRRLPGRPAAVPLRAAPPLLPHAQSGRGAPYRAPKRSPVCGERRRHGARVQQAQHVPAAHRSHRQLGRHAGCRGRAPGSALCHRRGLCRVQDPPRRRGRPQGQARRLHRPRVHRHRRRLHHHEGRARGRGRPAAAHLVRQQQRRHPGHGQGHHGRFLQPHPRRLHHRPRDHHGLRRGAAHRGPQGRFRRDRDRCAPARRQGIPARRRVYPGHRRPGHEVLARQGRRHRAHHAQRGLLVGLRQLYREFRRVYEHGRACVRRCRHPCQGPGRFGQSLHGLYEFARQAGAKGRRHGGRHRGRPVLFRHQECPVQGH